MIAIAFLTLLFPLYSLAQNWPDKIDGYKLHDAKIVVTNGDLKASDTSGDAIVSVGFPQVVDIGLSGVTLEITADFVSKKENGKVDFITFRNVTVNGLKLEVDEYRHAFEFKKGTPLSIPKPARISIRSSALPRAALNELVSSPKEVSVTGTAFVFGRFKKFGFSFKRVVPVAIDLTFANPLKSLRDK